MKRTSFLWQVLAVAIAVPTIVLGFGTHVASAETNQCSMSINLGVSDGWVYINTVGWFQDGAMVSLPVGTTISYRATDATKNISTGWATKSIDCNPLAPAYCDMEVDIPAGTYVYINTVGWFQDGAKVWMPTGATISYRATDATKNISTGWLTKNVDCSNLKPGFCNMAINNPAGGQVEISNTGSFTNGQSVVLPAGVNISWRLKVNGQTSRWYDKTVDCQPLAVVKDTHYCDMGIQAPAGKTVEISGTGRFINGQTVTLPICVTISYRVDGGVWQTKHIDCTPLVIEGANKPPTANAGGPYTVDEGGSITVTASGSDPEGGPLIFKWDLDNDGTFETPGQSVPFIAAGLDGLSSRTITVWVEDSGGLTAGSPATVTVNNFPPTVDAGVDVTIKEGGTFTGSGSFTDPGADTWTATVDYGDGSGAQSLTLNSKSFNLSHTYGDNGIYTVTVTVTDDDGGVGSDIVVVMVDNAAPAVNAGGDVNINEGGTFSSSGSFTDPGADTWTATVDYGDGSDTQPLALLGKSFSLLSYVYADNGIYTVTIAVTDDDGGVGSVSLKVTVNNVAPVVGAVTAPVDPVQVNTLVNTSASFSDPGMKDTHTATWDWGDGSTSAGTVTETNGSGSAGGSHSYTAAGVYTIKLTVADKDGGSGTSVTSQYVVVYNPSGGFVTGGGWINSPAGACVASPSLTGKATFGFVSKYQKGATVPTGQTEFQFKVAGLNFKSTSYEWLVIASARAQYKGTGTINGLGNYGFMLTAIDGQINGGGGLDKFRIKIWDKDTNDAIVYDNKLGAADDAEPDTVIGGGSIVIHKG